jgi:serine/threonine protein kinase
LFGYDLHHLTFICTLNLFLIFNYQAKLDEGKVVIKKIHVSNEELKQKKQLRRELQLIRKLQHPNIVELVGFCYEYSGSLVVPEKSNDVKFQGNGDLGIISRYASEKTMDDVNKGTHFH